MDYIIKKPTKFGNSIYLLMTDLVDEERYYKISKGEDGTIIVKEIKD